MPKSPWSGLSRARDGAKKKNPAEAGLSGLEIAAGVFYASSLEIMLIATPYDLAMSAKVSPPEPRRLIASARW